MKSKPKTIKRIPLFGQLPSHLKIVEARFPKPIKPIMLLKHIPQGALLTSEIEKYDHALKEAKPKSASRPKPSRKRELAPSVENSPSESSTEEVVMEDSLNTL